MKRLLLLILLVGCEDSGSGACVKEGSCCPAGAEYGGSCGVVRTLCALETQGTCTCGTDYTWHCFGTQDLAVRIRPDLREGDL